MNVPCIIFLPFFTNNNNDFQFIHSACIFKRMFMLSYRDDYAITTMIRPTPASQADVRLNQTCYTQVSGSITIYKYSYIYICYSVYNVYAGTLYVCKTYLKKKLGARIMTGLMHLFPSASVPARISFFSLWVPAGLCWPTGIFLWCSVIIDRELVARLPFIWRKMGQWI